MSAWPARARPPATAEATQLYFDGKAVTAREQLIRQIDGPEGRDPGARLAAMSVLLDICLHSYADACVIKYGPEYAELAKTAPAANAVIRAEQARKAAYYFDAARLKLGRPAVTAQILDWEVWKHENAANGELYLQRRLLASDVLLAQGKRTEALAEVDRILSLIASLKNPQAARFQVACALTDVIRTLLDLGQTERAYGLYRASARFIGATLAPKSVDAAVFRLAEAQVLQAVGDVAGAGRALATATTVLDENELDADTRDWLLGQVRSLRAMTCALQSDLTCAREAVAGHPAAKLYARAGRAPGSTEELTYLAVRALVGSTDRTADPLAVASLSGPLGFTPEARDADAVAAVRSAGRALALPAGPERQAAFGELGRAMQAAAARNAGATPGAWYRPDVADQLMTAFALTGSVQPRAQPVSAAEADTAFALFQLAARAGPSFDADALSVLGQARDPLDRRTIHEALRLRARRDRLEREAVLAMVGKAGGGAPAPAILDHDPAERLMFRDFARRIAAADTQLAAAGVVLSGANLTPLARLQQSLAADEVVLSVAPAIGGLGYMCVRRDGVFLTTGPVDAGRMKVDTRLLQVALSATYAPSEGLDAQFPAEAAVRLYDALIRPFAPCLKPGDRMVWLSGMAVAGVPLSALLSAPPPKLTEGYDLAAARWLVRDHAVSYAGSASALVAARTGRAGAAAFDFLGIGDPVLGHRAQAGGARFADLAPLPDTRIELEASAQGFRAPLVLTGAAATESRFRGQLTGAYRFLSFATHGLMRDDIEGLSEPALVLTPVADRGSADDGLLTASEIADLNLAAGFVALSACNTANFDPGQVAQDLPALASAFAVAGTPSTLGTLWPVNSETGRAVVAAIFGRLASDPRAGPAAALADAQRAFLAAPPSKAYLHPRFWAPFVILGDGGALPAQTPQPGAPAVTGVELLTEGGGETMNVRRGPGGVAARFAVDRGALGQVAGGVRSGGPKAWRRETPGIAASPFFARLESTVIATGYDRDAAGRLVPVIEGFSEADGAPVALWRGDRAGMVGAGVFGGVQTARDRALVVVGESTPSGPAAWLKVLEVGPSLTPRLLFETKAPAGVILNHATIAARGGDLVLTYTQAYPAPAAPPRTEDDYDIVTCAGAPITWIEVRDARTGALKSTREMKGVRVHAALGRGGEVLLGGAARTGCEEARAVVLTLDRAGESRTLYADDRLGESMVWSLAALPKGGTFVAASKLSVVDYTPARAGGVDAVRLDEQLRGVGGLVLVLEPDGRARPARTLDAGGPVYVNGADASRPDDILLGASLGGQAAIFHLSLPAAPR